MSIHLRLWCALTAVLAVVFLVAGCSGDDAAEASGATRAYQDANGTTVQIPENPSRVITISESSLDAALALDVTPVGTSAARGQTTAAAYLGSSAASIPIVASSGSPNLQQILKLDPDLIVVDDTTGAKNSIGELSKIAPTVMVGRFTDPWQVYFQNMANVLNRPEQHQKKLDEISAQIATTKSIVQKTETDGTQPTATVLRWSADGPTIVGGSSLSTWVLNQVGMVRPAAQAAQLAVKTENRSGQKVSLENIDLIDADHIFFGALAGQEQATKDLAAAEQLPGFSSLKAAQTDQIYPVDGVPWTSATGPLGIEVMLTDISKSVS
ncbi:ABC transporter substrate-binding protein [Gordonia sp. NPDC003424]